MTDDIDLQLKYGPALHEAKLTVEGMSGPEKLQYLQEMFGRNAHAVMEWMAVLDSPTRWDHFKFRWLVKRALWKHRILKRLGL